MIAKVRETKHFHCGNRRMKDDIFNRIRPKQPLKELKWFDIGIVTAILFGQFIVRSTQLF